MADAGHLEREARVFARYLGQPDPPAELVARYRAAHDEGIVATREGSTRFDRALVSVARAGGVLTRLADAHARLFRPGGLLRRKLVLVLALLEVHGASSDRIDAPTTSSLLGFSLGLAARGFVFALLAVLGLIVFLPLRVLCALGGSESTP